MFLPETQFSYHSLLPMLKQLNRRIFSLVLMRWIIAAIQIAGLNTLNLLKKCQILQQRQGLKENQK